MARAMGRINRSIIRADAVLPVRRNVLFLEAKRGGGR